MNKKQITIGHAFLQKEGVHDMDFLSVIYNTETESLSASTKDGKKNVEPNSSSAQWTSPVPKCASIWAHRKNPSQHYALISNEVALSIETEKEPITCSLYVSTTGGSAWLRPNKDFLDGRFSLVKNPLPLNP